MSELLTTLGTIVTQVFAWAGNVAQMIVDTPLLLLTSGVMLAGAAVGIFGRLLSRN